MSQSNNDSINIAVLISSSMIGGAERITSEIVRTFSKKKNYQIIVCYLKQPGEIGLELIKEGIESYSNINIKKYNFFGIFKLLKIFKKNKIDIIYIADNNNAMFLGVLASLINKKYKTINAIHNTNNIYENKFIIPIRRILNRRIDRIVALSETHKNYLISGLEKIPASKIINIHNGIDPKKFESIKKKNNTPTVGIIASLTPRKDHTTFLLAAAEVRKQLDDVEFLIIGDGPERNNIKYKVNELNLGRIVKLTGNINDITKILPDLDIVVLSSKPIGETFPVSILEAQASGIPVISTDVGSIREIISDKETGFLVPVGDYKKIAERILELIRNDKLAKEISKKAKISVMRFTKTRMIDSYDSLFKSMVNNANK